jgi:acetylornithine deacetylase/succinyl-diaminopimelate desuccinylase-like protein
MTKLEAALQYARAHQEQALTDLKHLLEIPSISTLSEHQPDMQLAAGWLVKRLKDLGFDEVGLLQTDGHPVVYGEWMQAGDSAPTVLVYGHYDVQPADPVEKWNSPPFDPVRRGDDLFARGASDMKAQVIAHLRAVEAMLQNGGLPLNIKYLIEGEEEIGSPHLGALIEAEKVRLRCDLSLNLDSSILGPDTPSITYALRGLAYFELRLKGPGSDLHSGLYGGVVHNPANVLARLIAGMRDENGRVTLPGFYDDVRDLSAAERDELSRLPTDDAWWNAQIQAPQLFGEAGYSATERATARPTLDVNGILSGFTGEGSKTVIPSTAMAKISMRLVPDQHPEKIETALRAYLEAHAPDTVTWELLNHAGAVPSMMDLDSNAIKAAGKALEAVWGVKPLYKREGGTVPVVGMIRELLDANSLMLGFGLPDDNLHAPNEKVHLPNFFRGIETLIHFSHIFGSV